MKPSKTLGKANPFTYFEGDTTPYVLIGGQWRAVVEQDDPLPQPMNRWVHTALLMGLSLALVLVVLGAAQVITWLTGAGLTIGLTSCATHLAHSPIPTALPSAPVH